MKPVGKDLFNIKVNYFDEEFINNKQGDYSYQPSTNCFESKQYLFDN